MAVSVDLGHGIEYCWILTATLDTSLKPRKNQLWPIPSWTSSSFGKFPVTEANNRWLLFHHNQYWEAPPQLKKSSQSWLTEHIFGETILVKIENEIMNKVKLITDNDDRVVLPWLYNQCFKKSITVLSIKTEYAEILNQIVCWLCTKFMKVNSLWVLPHSIQLTLFMLWLTAGGLPCKIGQVRFENTD